MAFAQPFEQLAIETRIKRRKTRLLIRIIRNVARKLVHFGIEVVDVVYGDRFGGHRQLRTAEFVRPMMRQDQVFESQRRFRGEWFAEQFLGLSDFGRQHFDGNHQVPEQLAFVGIAAAADEVQLADLAEIVQKDAGQKQAAIDPREEIVNPTGNLEHVDNMFEQPSLIGVVGLHSGRSGRERRHERLVDQKAIEQCTNARIGDRLQNLAQSRGELSHVALRLLDEIGRIESFYGNRLHLTDDHLQGALIKLHFAFDMDVIARIDMGDRFFRHVPHSGADGPRLVSQFDKQVQGRVAVGPQLLVGQ